MKYLLFPLVLFVLLNFGCKKDDPDPVKQENEIVEYEPLAVEKTNNMQLFVHYMPWFEDKSTSDNGNWGWHWTMSNQNPDIVDSDGRRQIASHYYPIIGPYASSDKDLIEYHLLLMKYSGIDGILIDWYGSSDTYDYGTNRRNTDALVDMLDEVGLKFAIVYEDATISSVMENTGETDAISLARNDMNYIRQNYFNLDTYIKIDGQPLLMVFGPQYFKEGSEWESVVSALANEPTFLSLWGFSSQLGSTAGGEFIWVDLTDIDKKYADKDNFNTFMGGAWPGFDDFYSEGGAGDNLFVIDRNNGAVWSDLLEKAKTNNMDYLQLITWNDFGEGTIIEPTLEFGYSYLEELQSFAGTSYTKSDLEAVTEQYQLRKSKSEDKESQKALDQAFYYWVSLQNEKAIALIDSISN